MGIQSVTIIGELPRQSVRPAAGLWVIGYPTALGVVEIIRQTITVELGLTWDCNTVHLFHGGCA